MTSLKAALLVGSLLFLLFGDEAQEEAIIKLTIYLVDYSTGWLNDDYIESKIGSTGPAGHHPGAALHHVETEEERRREWSDCRLEICCHGGRSYLSLYFHHVHHRRHAGRALLSSAHHRPVDLFRSPPPAHPLRLLAPQHNNHSPI